MTSYKKAFVIGKFHPPHKGHEMVIAHAANLAHEVVVAVEQQAGELIDVELRSQWLQQVVAPNVTVVPLHGIHPAAPPLDEKGQQRFWNHWKRVVASVAPDVDLVVSADAYGKKLAADQSADWAPVDRSILPISSTWFKENPWERWSWLIAPAREHMVRRVVVVGAESTGKSSLCQQLARRADAPTICVPEYAAHWIANHQDKEWNDDALRIFENGQLASRKSCLPYVDKWMVEDSHLLTTMVWAQYLGHHDLAQEMERRARSDRPHHVIVSAVDGAPWVADLHRPSPSNREEMETLFVQTLLRWGWSFDVVSGPWNERTQQAIASVDRQLTQWKTMSWPQWCLAPGQSLGNPAPVKTPNPTPHTNNRSARTSL